MVYSSEEYQHVLLCVCPDVDLIKSCDPNETMFSSEDTMDHDEVMDGCQVSNISKQIFHRNGDNDLFCCCYQREGKFKCLLFLFAEIVDLNRLIL